MANYRPGELDQLITFSERAYVPDGVGGNVTTWTELGDVWALAKPMSGSEKTDFETVNEEATYLFVIRWPLGIDVNSSFRITWDEVYYNVRLIKVPKGRDLYCEIVAERGAGQ